MTLASMWTQHRVVLCATVGVFLLSFLISYSQVDLALPQFLTRSRKSAANSGANEPARGRDKQQPETNENPTGAASSSRSKSKENSVDKNSGSDSKPDAPQKIFTAKELAQYDGSPKSKGLYLAILGRVFDVSKGEKHYGPGGGYHFFAGKDATRAFVSGDFSDKGLTDDITGLSPTELLGIEEWIRFYEKDYETIGVLQGSYYDSRGKPTAKLKSVLKHIDEAHKWQATEKAETELFPPCNSEWSSGKGGRVWCTNKSGGISREWAGVPRKLFKPGSSSARCACVKNFGPPSDNSADKNRGDLDNPALQEYSGCNTQAVSCQLKDN